jgi:uncharacterized membrane protein
MGVVLIAIFIGAAFVGVAGQLASSLLWPVFAAGMAIAARALDSGGEMEFGHLFAGFHTRTAALIAVGALYLAVYLAVVLLVSQATGIPMLVLLGAEPQTDVDPRMVLLAVLTVLALLLPVFMAVWFAAPLIVFHQHGALEAMKGSFAGCVKNILPFLWYGVIGMLLGIVASLPVLLGWLVLWPVFMASVYTGYRDIYLKPRARAGS